MEQSQDYSFNKAHAACYALIAYRTAWLKANHPCEYMAALISSVMNTKDRVPLYVNACDEMGIEVLPPDVNESRDRLRRRRGQDPLRPQRGQERRRQRRAGDHRGARGRRPVRVDLGLHRAGRPAGREQARARVARQVRRARLDRRLAAWGCSSVLEQALAYGQKLAPTGSPGRARSSTSASAAPRRRGRAEAPSADPADEFEKSRAAAAREGDARPLRLRAPAHAVATSCGARPTRRSPSSSAAATARSSRSAASSRRVKQLTTKKGEPMVFLRSTTRPARGGRRLQLDLRGGARALRRRPHPRRQGPHRPQAAGRDEADRARADAVRGGAGASRRPLPDRRAPGAGRHDRELARLVQEYPGESPVYVAIDTSMGPRTLALGPEYRVQPDSDFFAEAKALLGEVGINGTAEVTAARRVVGRAHAGYDNVREERRNHRANGATISRYARRVGVSKRQHH